MKNVILLLVLVLSMFSCKNETKVSKTPVQAENSTNKVQVDDYLKPLFLSGNYVFRGTDFTMNRDQVTEIELVPVTKKTSNSLMFTEDLTDDSFIDVTYFFQNKLNKIEANIYSKNDQEAQKYYNGVVNYLNKKYTKRGNIWEGKSDGVNFTAFIKKMDSSKFHGSYLVFEKY